MLMKPEKQTAIVAPENVDQFVAAAEEMMHAIETKNPQALAEAMKAFVSMCDSYEDAQESEQED